MNEIEEALQRHYQRRGGKIKKETNRISKCFTKVLLSIILLLCCTIYMKLKPENKEILEKNIFENNLAFTKVNDWYTNTFGSILPSVTEPKDTLVSSNSFVKEPYLDGYKVLATKDSAIANLASGLFVFQGEKEGYGNTFILQGVDGVDIWYGGIKDSDLTLYDYVDAGTILGVSIEDYYYLAFQKDGKFITYEEYFEQVSS